MEGTICCIVYALIIYRQPKLWCFQYPFIVVFFNTFARESTNKIKAIKINVKNYAQHFWYFSNFFGHFNCGIEI